MMNKVFDVLRIYSLLCNKCLEDAAAMVGPQFGTPSCIAHVLIRSHFGAFLLLTNQRQYLLIFTLTLKSE